MTNVKPKRGRCLSPAMGFSLSREAGSGVQVRWMPSPGSTLGSPGARHLWEKSFFLLNLDVKMLLGGGDRDQRQGCCSQL